MEEKSFTKKLYDQVEEYAKTSVELYKLKAINTFADLFASVSTGFILGVIYFLILFFISIGLGFYFGELFGKWHYGFFAVAGIYAIIAVFIYIYRIKCLKEKINNYIIRQIFKD